MASSYPSSLDSFTDPTSGSSLASPSHSGQHIDLNDAVEKLETKLGIGSSPASSAVDGAVLVANGSGTTTYSSTGYGVWTSFTPSWTNLTVGNATQTFAYSQMNKTMFIRGKIVFGSTTTMGTYPDFLIPNSGSAVNKSLGLALYLDSGTDNYTGLCRADGTKVYLQSNYTGGTWGTMGAVTATAPFTWATNDTIWLSVVIQLS